MHDRMTALDYGLAGLDAELSAMERDLGCPCGSDYGDAGDYGDRGARAGGAAAGVAAGAGAAAIYGGGSVATGLTSAGTSALSAPIAAAAGGSGAALLAPAALIAAPAVAVGAAAGWALSYRATSGNVNRLKAKIAELEKKIEQEEKQRSTWWRNLRIKSWKRQIERAQRRLDRIERVMKRRVGRRGGESARQARVLDALGRSSASQSPTTQATLNLVGRYVQVVLPRANYYRLQGRPVIVAVAVAIKEARVPDALRAEVGRQVRRALKAQASVQPAPAPRRGGFVPPGLAPQPRPRPAMPAPAPGYPMPTLPAPVYAPPAPPVSPAAISTVSMTEGLVAQSAEAPVPSGSVADYDPYSSGIFQPYRTAAPDGSTIDQTAAAEPGMEDLDLGDVPLWRRPSVLVGGALLVGAVLWARRRKAKGKGKGKAGSMAGAA